MIGELPRDHVLEPGRRVLFDPAGKADAVLQRDVAEVIDGQRNFRADLGAHFGHVLVEEVEALFGKMQARERVHDVLRIVARIERAALVGILGRAAAGMVAERLDRAGWSHHRTRNVGDLHQAEVHLEEGEAEVHALLEALAHRGAARAIGIGIAIDPHLIAELAAQHLVDRHAIGLACEIPQRDLDR